MNFMRHIGKHNDKRCVIVFRKIPELEHMALVVYSDLLPRLIHDEVMRAVESPQGQDTIAISDVLFRTIMADGNNCLQALHKNGLLKKVPTNQILMTPNSTSSVRLDELNDLLDEIEKGKEAIGRLEAIEESRGLTGRGFTGKRSNILPRAAEIKEIGSNVTREAQGNTSAIEALPGFISDSDLISKQLDQAAKMEANAQQLLAEAQKLKLEAQSLSLKVENVGTETKETTTKEQTA